MKFIEIEQGIYRAQENQLSMNVGLILGTQRALVVDTGAGPAEAEVIKTAVREVTDLPLYLVNTHGHFDHFFGNEILAGSEQPEIYAHPNLLPGSMNLDEARAAASRVDASVGADFQPLWPTKFLKISDDGSVLPQEIDLGSMTVTLFHLGRGHTDHDLLVGAGSVLFAGDLVEESGDPHFDGSYPEEWVKTLGKITALEEIYSQIVPGHGEIVTMDFVKTQRAKMRQAVSITQTAMREASVDMTKAVPILPYGPSQSRVLLRRLRELAGWHWFEEPKSEPAPHTASLGLGASGDSRPARP